MEKVIEIPESVSIEINGLDIAVKGPKGELKKSFEDPRFNKSICIEKNNVIKVKTDSEKRKVKALVGTIATIIKNMIMGVTIGYKYTMKIVYKHFPMNVSCKDNEVLIKNFLGEKGARKAKVIGNTEVKIEKEQITLIGISNEDVGQTASNIEQACRISGRDRRVFVDGIYRTGRYLQNDEPL